MDTSSIDHSSYEDTRIRPIISCNLHHMNREYYCTTRKISIYLYCIDEHKTHTNFAIILDQSYQYQINDITNKINSITKTIQSNLSNILKDELKSFLSTHIDNLEVNKEGNISKS
jgi:hypothetical protein